MLARPSLRLTRREEPFNLSQSRKAAKPQSRKAAETQRRRDAKDFLGGLCGFARDMIEI